jgi:hypothetical protein
LDVKAVERFGDTVKKNSKFDESEDEEEFDAKAFKDCKALLKAINAALKSKKAAQHFPKLMERSEFREKMRDLRVS